jgi:hypothetical protein
MVLALVLACYARFDCHFYLCADVSTVLARRPDTDMARFALLSGIYDEITARAAYVRFRSDLHLLAAVLHRLQVHA